MKFLIGSQNFGFDTEDSDMDYVEFVYPDIHKLCCPIPKTKEVKGDDGHMVKVIDIRSLPSLFYKSNLDVLQLLFSKDASYSWLTKYFFMHEKELSTINLPRLYSSIMGSNKSRLKKGTPKDLAHVIFGYKTLINFHEQGFTDLRSCFEHSDRDIYLEIRSGKNHKKWLEYCSELELEALLKEMYYKEKLPNDEFMREFEQDISVELVDTLHHNELYKDSLRKMYDI